MFSLLWPTFPLGHLVTQSWPPSALSWPLLMAGPWPGLVMAAHASGCGYLSPFLLGKVYEPCTLLKGRSGLPTAGVTEQSSPAGGILLTKGTWGTSPAWLHSHSLLSIPISASLLRWGNLCDPHSRSPFTLDLSLVFSSYQTSSWSIPKARG